MNIYFTVEEKYLQAIRKVNYGRTPKALRLLKEILDNDPLHGRTHYQLGKLYYYQLDDYQTAGFHFKTCMDWNHRFRTIILTTCASLFF
jgi:tetratricopeptide (TPR) repeat protein